MGVVLPTMEVPMGSSEVPPPPTQQSPEFEVLSSRAIVAGPSGSLAIVARPWAGSASHPHPSQPIANLYTIHSVTNGWLFVSGLSTIKRDTHRVRMAIVVSSP